MPEVASPPAAVTGETIPPPDHPRDPWAWCLAVALAFAALASVRLTIPSAPFFDEVHYLPAARAILEGGEYMNREHPLLAKELIALGIWLFGDGPLGWRIMPLLAGTLAVGAAMRALWHASLDRYATLAFGVLLASGFHLFVLARIAMLDIVMAAFLSFAAWQFAAACREPETGRWRLAVCGVALGCALGSKWNAIPLAMLPGLAFFAARLSAGRRRLLTSRRGVPVPGVSLVEAFCWLGLLPLFVYALTFLPGYWLGAPLRPSPLAGELFPLGLVDLHAEILELQKSVMAPHNYQSTWPQWVMNTRGIWFLYEFTDGAQRGVLLIGNPLTMLLGLPALLWCMVTGVWQRDWAKVGVGLGYAASLGLWVVAPKPVQFYYHYMMPSVFLLAALALALSDMRSAPRLRWLGWAVPLASAAFFALFWKVLSAAPLDSPMSFADWTWIAGWR